jgi:hypothetical protein
MTDNENSQNETTELATNSSQKDNTPGIPETELKKPQSNRFGQFFSRYKLTIGVGIITLIFGLGIGTMLDHHSGNERNLRGESREIVQHHFNNQGHEHQGRGQFRR